MKSPSFVPLRDSPSFDSLLMCREAAMNIDPLICLSFLVPLLMGVSRGTKVNCGLDVFDVFDRVYGRIFGQGDAEVLVWTSEGSLEGCSEPSRNGCRECLYIPGYCSFAAFEGCEVRRECLTHFEVVMAFIAGASGVIPEAYVT